MGTGSTTRKVACSSRCGVSCEGTNAARTFYLSGQSIKMYKRTLVDDDGPSDQKRFRVEDESNDSNALVAVTGSTALTISQIGKKKEKVSILEAPNVLLTGHTDAVYSLSFDPTGHYLASGSRDRQILLWDVHDRCSNYNVLTGHKNAVLEVKWTSSGSTLISCSADKTVGLWDANKGVRLRRFTGHSAIVNSCAVAKDVPTLFASGSDDCTVIVWDQRSRGQVHSLYHDYQVTSVCLSADGKYVYSGGIDNIIRRFDLRSSAEEIEADLSLASHNDTVTGLSLSPDGEHLLSNSMDSTLRSWDVRPFVTGSADGGSTRCERSYSGVHHGAEKLLLRCSWSTNQEQVTCGSADRMVRIWDSSTAELQYYLPGHKGSVNDVIFHPTESIVASGGSDKQIFLGELATGDEE